ncbi:hypothetical protein V8F06_014660 [Rhypophila decipiens]
MDAMESPRSPKRRRILASINTTGVTDPDREAHREPAISPPSPGLAGRSAPEFPGGETPADPPAEPAHPDSKERQTSEPRASRVRFKSSRHRRHREEDDDHHRRHRDRDQHRDRDRDKDRDRDRDPESSREKDKDDGRSSRHRHRPHRSRSRSRSRSPKSSSHRHHHPRRHHHRSTRKESQPPEPEPQDPFAEEPLDPEVAFRESLFDAMADDEGAAYWEGVYGQPVHIYSSDRLNPQGELERMTDEEYAAHVRQKMWEKTHAGLLEEREKRKKQAEERTRKEEEARRIQAEMERSLRRGEKRRAKRTWVHKWDAYVDAWNKWDGKSVVGIPWPVDMSRAVVGEEDGRREVDHAAVRAFFVNGLNLEEVGEKEFVAKLKDERVRWHPDKFQQKLGGTVDEGVMRDVTAIFQVIDALWNDTRKSS